MLEEIDQSGDIVIPHPLASTIGEEVLIQNIGVSAVRDCVQQVRCRLAALHGRLGTIRLCVTAGTREESRGAMV